MDTYIIELYDCSWSACQAPTQFPGTDSSHELAALSITEAVVQGLHINKEPIFLLLLDAQNAFDRVVIEHTVRCAYLAGRDDQGLLYLDKSRRRSRGQSRTPRAWGKGVVRVIKCTG